MTPVWTACIVSNHDPVMFLDSTFHLPAANEYTVQYAVYTGISMYQAGTVVRRSDYRYCTMNSVLPAALTRDRRRTTVWRASGLLGVLAPAV
eukprot:COSAG02_NODE_4003_length_5927_cov_5.624914_9_plen_92_part_00